MRFSPQMVALQSKGSNSSLNNLRSSLATGDNPRRGSASGVYGLPVPPDNLKLGGTSNLTGERGSPDTANSQRDLDSCTGTPNNSGRNSPVCWQTPSLAKHNRSNGDHQPETKVRGFGAFNSIYDVGFKFPQIRSIFAKYQENKSKDSSHNNGKVSGFKKILKILTFGLSGNSQG